MPKRREADYPPRVTPALDLFATCTPGLEAILAGELTALGLTPKILDGGVAFAGNLSDMMRANLWLRTAGRVLVRVAEFHASSFDELERHARRVAWSEWLAPTSVTVSVSASQSRLYHTGAIAERLLAAIARPAAAKSTDHERHAGQLVLARFVRDRCTLSIDTSGELLHRRGYRLDVAKAPLRETLAAAILLAAGYDGARPLVDPLCGSGTIPIEAALIARRIAPGRRRDFAFRGSPYFDDREWKNVLDKADEMVSPTASAPIFASDRDAGAVRATTGNAQRAGVGGDLGVELRAFAAGGAPLPGGLFITNPPYGVRIGERRSVSDLYARLVGAARARVPGGRLAVLCSDGKWAEQKALREVVTTKNGGLSVRLLMGDVL